MNLSRFRYVIPLLAIFIAPQALIAQATRTWVSGVGDDANPCSRTAPCKTFAGAISKTADGGEISVLDPGGFGAVTITKSITIDGAGQLSSILSASTNGVIVNAQADDVVTLRNITINGVSKTNSPGINGVRFLKGRSLHLVNVDIHGFSTHCVDVNLNQATAADISIVNSRLSECGGSGVKVINNASFPAFGSFDNISVFGSGAGVTADANAILFVNRSNLSHNSSGVVLQNPLALSGNPSVTLNDNMIIGNNGGVQAGPGAVRISRNTISQNGVGLFIVGGTVVSFGNNQIAGNSTDGNPTGTTALK